MSRHGRIRKKIQGGIIQGGIVQGGIVQGGMIQIRRHHPEPIRTGEPVSGNHGMTVRSLLNLHLAMAMSPCLAILMPTVGPQLMMLRSLLQRDLGGRANVKLAVKMRRLISGKSTRS